MLRTHQFSGLRPGPRLIILGAVHGNEVCGTRALERLIRELDTGELKIERGTLTLVPITNPLAYAQGERQGDRNLNRNLRPIETPNDFEDHIANVLCPLLAAHDVLLDLHSFHTAGEPFVMVGPRNNTGTLEPFSHAAAEEKMAAHLGPQRMVEGWLETYELGVQRRRESLALHNTSNPQPQTHQLDPAYGMGTTEYMRAHGGYGITIECGQHEDATAPSVAYHAIRQTIALLEFADIPLAPPKPNPQILRLADVIDLAHPEDTFTRPWSSFDPVAAGEVIGHRHNGEVVTAPAAGFIVFPNPKALPGNEWFYFAQSSERRIYSKT